MFLDDVRVLDVTQVVAGSFASMTLADLGADVLKVERPDGGDLGRDNPPFVGGESAYFASVNRNKRSVAVDLSDGRGRDALLDLAEGADVLVENHPPGRMDRFGLGYDDVRERNGSIVYCSITGFGQTGPYADVPALDMAAQALSGAMSVTGPPDGPPYRAGLPFGDIAGSSYAVHSVLAALFRRERTGEGAYVDVPMADSLIAWLTVRAGYTFATGEPYPRTGNELEEFVPYNVYPTADGYLAVIAATDRHWRRIREVLGIDADGLDADGLDADGLDADGLDAVEARRERRDEVNALLREALADRSAEEWFDRLAAAGVPSAPVRDTASVWEDDHVEASGLRRDVPLGGEGFSAIAYPARFADADPGIERGAPALGEHTRDALREAGYDDAAVDTLAAEGVIAEPDRE